mmetsp:Transcript_25714/g.46545  ORF Transcript_25714/g.46545 Transcript_25714/m.46545 type:complete len:577 (-) Transcript_25714:313-2043(-)
MKCDKVFAVVLSVFVCWDIKADSVDEDKPRHGKIRGVPVKQNYYPTVPVPPVPGSDLVLPDEVRRHYQEYHLQEDLKLWSPMPQLRHSPSGRFPNLVLLLRFADHASRDLPSRDDISHLYNSEDFPLDDRTELIKESGRGIAAPTGSVRQVYFENSHSTFTVDTTVVDWITLSGTEAYYADGQQGLSKSKFKEAMIEALNVVDADSTFDFDAFDLDENGALDGFGVLHSGYGAEFGGTDCQSQAAVNDRIWSHKGGFDWASTREGSNIHSKRYYVSSALRGTCKSRIVRMGVLCHELGHYLGLPDLYDTTFKGKGLGGYDFMSLSWGWDGSGLYPGNLSAWSKLQLGWATADLIDADGTYELEAATSTGIKIYKITHGFPNPEKEYLLLENRQQIAYDSKIKHGGIAIYHVDETARGQQDCGFPSQPGWPENGNHYKVALLSASGVYDLEENINAGDEGDLWHANTALKELGPGPNVFPNTDYYEKATKEVGRTGIRIFGFSESGILMSFSVEGLGVSAADGATQAAHQPSRAPTQSPGQRMRNSYAPTTTSAPTTLREEEDPVEIPPYQSVVSLA